MAYSKVYTRIVWVNESDSKITPLGAINLNKMDYAIDQLDERIVDLSLEKAEQSTVLNMVSDWTLDENTGIITITKVNGEQILFDLNIEKIPVSFSLSEDGILTMTTDDGTEFTADIGSMIPVLTFKTSETISVTVTENENGKEYSFDVIKGSITDEHLQPNYLADITVQSQNASNSATSASNSADISTTKASEASTSATQAKQYRDEAESFKNQASAIVGVDIATEDVPGLMRGGDNLVGEDGELILTKTTTDRTLYGSHPGGLKVNSIEGESQQNGEPTPDAPIDINSVVVSEIWGCGKNLMKAGSYYSTLNGVTATINDDKSVTLNGTASATGYIEVGRNTVQAGEYILSGCPKGGSSSTYRIVSLEPSGAYDVGNGARVELTEATRLNVRIYAYSGTVFNKLTFYPMLSVEGGTYEPFTEKRINLSNPITLRGIGDVKDAIVKQDGVYGVLRNITSFIPSVNNSYSLSGTTNFAWIATSNLPTPINSENKDGYCSHLIMATSSELTNATVDYGFYFGNSINFRVKGLTTVDEYINFFGSNEVQFDYVNETPTFEPLPLADQIELHQLETFGTVTHLFTDSTIEPVIEVEYGTSVVGAYALKGMNDIAELQNKEDTYATKTAVFEIDARVTSLENSSGSGGGLSDAVLLGSVSGTADSNSASVTLKTPAEYIADGYKYLVVALYHKYAGALYASTFIPSPLGGQCQYIGRGQNFEIGSQTTATYASSGVLSLSQYMPANTNLTISQYESRLYGI